MYCGKVLEEYVDKRSWRYSGPGWMGPWSMWEMSLPTEDGLELLGGLQGPFQAKPLYDIMIRGWKTSAYLSVLLRQQVTGRWRDPAEIGLYSDQAVLAGKLWLQRDPRYLQSCLDCGASPAGGGAVSSERLAEGREKPTSNISRASTKTERHDAQVEKEASDRTFGKWN